LRATLAIGSVAVFVVSLDSTALFVAFPAIRADFADTTIEQLSWVLNAYTIVYGALLVTAGRLADQVGRRRTFAFGLVAFGASSLTCALAPSAWSLVAARALQGVGAAALIPSSLALALAAGRTEERSLIAALWAAMGALAAAVGPSLGALLVDTFGWRSIFLVNVPVTLSAAALVRKHVTESRDVSLPDWPRVGSSLTLVGGSAMLGLAVVEGRAWGTGTSALLALLGLASLGTFALVEVRSRAPSFDLSLFRTRAFAVANATVLVFSVGFSLMFLGFVFFLTREWGYGVVRAGLAISPGPLTVIPVAIISGKLAPRVGHRALVVLGGLMLAAGGWMASGTLGSEPAFVSRWLPMAIVTGIGVGLVLPSLNGAAVAGLPTERFAVGSAIHQAIRQLGSVLGVALAIVLSTLPTGAEATFLALALIGVVCAALGIALPKLAARDVRSTEIPRPRNHALVNNVVGEVEQAPTSDQRPAAHEARWGDHR
jgi:EmrB/QacA subfamily drug resistance transporter